MEWSERRIQQYKQGQQASWLEKRILEHANPVHLVLMLLGVVPLIYGLWAHNWPLIGLGILLNLLGHVYCRVKK